MLAAALVFQKRYEDTAKLIARAEAAIPDDLSPSAFAARTMLRGGAELPKSEAYLKKYLDETKEPEAGVSTNRGRALVAGAGV